MTIVAKFKCLSTRANVHKPGKVHATLVLADFNGALSHGCLTLEVDETDHEQFKPGKHYQITLYETE